MPTGIYQRSNVIPGAFQKNQRPHNKGIQLDHVKTKVEKFKAGLDLECKTHGLHKEWRLHSSNNVQCKKCCSDRQRRDSKKYHIKYLLRYARGRKLDYDLNESFIEQMIINQDNRCALSGILFTDTLKPSIDRIDSNIGYLKQNVQLVLFEVNRMKSNLPQDRFIDLCRSISNDKK